MTENPTLHEELAAIVPVDRQPALRELYSPMAPEDVRSLFVRGGELTSRKTIIVHELDQYLGNAHSDLVIGQILDKKPSEFMQAMESLRLIGCGFIAHEIFTDGHVCKHPDRGSQLDCAHSISRKVLESAMALVSSEGEAPAGDEEWFAAFAESDHGIVRLDRAMGEVARGPIREDTVSTLTAETGLLQINEHTRLPDLVTMLPTLRSRVKAKQGEYGEPLLRLAEDVAPRLFRVLRRRLVEWQSRQDELSRAG
jgi:hypothetical protein